MRADYDVALADMAAAAPGAAVSAGSPGEAAHPTPSRTVDNRLPVAYSHRRRYQRPSAAWMAVVGAVVRYRS